MDLAIDHLVLCAASLDDAAAAVGDRLGALSVPGGLHTGLGTENRIVPLGPNYLEILAIADAVEASTNPFGRWAGERTEGELAVDAVCLRTSNLDSVCSRLGLDPTPMSRIRPDGVELSWRVAGIEEALNNGLPFFIEWGVPEELMPGATYIPGPSGETRLQSVTIAGEKRQLVEWVGETDRLDLREGSPSCSATFSTPRGEVSI
ncbi:MAG: VOC family protein [Actinomycetota bacterium]|nr:VOC family protein [Actinomycetota bacterium]